MGRALAVADWDLDDLTGLSDLAREYGCSREAVRVWSRLRHFPRPMAKIGNLRVFSRTQVAAWYELNRRRKPAALRPQPMSRRPRGVCGVCGREMALTIAGEVRLHSASGWQQPDWCPGSRKNPVRP